MTHGFDKVYWEQHWRQSSADGPGSMSGNPPNPYLASETSGLVPGTALDAGCGAGAEAIWLASRGWRVTAADISSEVLARAAERATASGASHRLQWVEADLSVWDPGMRFDLVTTHYAHPAMPQLEFYDRIADWVAPGGTLLIVAHLHTHGSTGHEHGPGRESEPGHDHGHGHAPGHSHGHRPPAEASVTVADITARLDSTAWEIVTADERVRTLAGRGSQGVPLHDVVVRAARHQ